MPVSEYSKDTDRTTDVQTQDQTPFHTIIKNHPIVLKGLTDCGYVNASPIQVAALPVIIAGNDTIVEAKNGTGKTLTFVIPTLMRLKIEQSHLQSIILAPTREIAVQIQQCFKKVGQFFPDLKCEYFIGGTPVEIDRKKANGCQIAVGSPGRIKHLLNEHVLKGSEVKSFILDEVDRLFTDKNFTKDVRFIDAKLPKLKQIIVASASIDKSDMSLFDEFMKEYIIVKGAEEDMNASQDPSKFLLGIKQYVACVKAVSTNIILLPAKNVRLLNILQNLPYTQCIIFTNYMTRVEAVCNMLRDHNYKADYIRGDQDQNIRLKLVDRLTSFKSKILVATDLIARGIDSSNVDLVINMDCPNDWATYLHRIGRAGRFGNKGNAFTILDDDKELKSFKHIINSIENVKIKMLPIVIKKPILEYDDTELEDLNLTIEPDVLTKPQNENNLIEENKAPNGTELKISDSESNISCSSVKSEQQNETKSDHEFGLSRECSLEKLSQVVKETEKNLIDNNLINPKHLTAERSFALFDPEPLLNDTDQYMKYSPQELVDIITNFDSDFEKYEASKNSASQKCILPKDIKKEISSNNQVYLENSNLKQPNNTNEEVKGSLTDQQPQCQNLPQNDSKEKQNTIETKSEESVFVNETNGVVDKKIDTDTIQRPRFTNIYDLFQIPDFSLLKPVQNDKKISNSSNETLAVEEDNGVSTWIHEKDSVQEEYEDEELFSDDSELLNVEEESSYVEEEELSNVEEEELSNVEEEFSNVDEEEEEEELSYVEEENMSSDEDIESESSNFSEDDHERFSIKSNNKSIHKSICSNILEDNVAPQKSKNAIKDNDEHLVDYDILNDWYRQWKQQMNFIQTCVRMSK